MDIRELLDEVQPYKRTYPTNHDLFVLNRLDIRDKHHQLLFAVVGVASAGWFGEWEMTDVNISPYVDGDEVCRMHGRELNTQGEPQPHLTFRIKLAERDAGAWQYTLGASDLVRRSLDYIDEEVLPRFVPFL